MQSLRVWIPHRIEADEPPCPLTRSIGGTAFKGKTVRKPRCTTIDYSPCGARTAV